MDTTPVTPPPETTLPPTTTAAPTADPDHDPDHDDNERPDDVSDNDNNGSHNDGADDNRSDDGHHNPDDVAAEVSTDRRLRTELRMAQPGAQTLPHQVTGLLPTEAIAHEVAHGATRRTNTGLG